MTTSCRRTLFALAYVATGADVEVIDTATSTVSASIPFDGTTEGFPAAIAIGGSNTSAAALVSNLVAAVKALNLSNGISNSLDVKLQNALAANDADAGDVPSACNRMDAFLNDVSAQSGKALTLAQATQLATMAYQVQAALGCN